MTPITRFPSPRKDFDCRFRTKEFCSIQVVNSIGKQWNSRTDPEARRVILQEQIFSLNSVPAGYPFEIILIDDGSDPATSAFLFECYSRKLINILILNNTPKIG